MHLLIFVFAGTHALDIDSFAIFTIVYAAYFFPWSIFRRNPPTGVITGL